jgi:hypothetical protein
VGERRVETAVRCARGDVVRKALVPGIHTCRSAATPRSVPRSSPRQDCRPAGSLLQEDVREVLIGESTPPPRPAPRRAAQAQPPQGEPTSSPRTAPAATPAPTWPGYSPPRRPSVRASAWSPHWRSPPWPTRTHGHRERGDGHGRRVAGCAARCCTSRRRQRVHRRAPGPCTRSPAMLPPRLSPTQCDVLGVERLAQREDVVDGGPRTRSSPPSSTLRGPVGRARRRGSAPQGTRPDL